MAAWNFALGAGGRRVFSARDVSYANAPDAGGEDAETAMRGADADPRRASRKRLQVTVRKAISVRAFGAVDVDRDGGHVPFLRPLDADVVMVTVRRRADSAVLRSEWDADAPDVALLLAGLPASTGLSLRVCVGRGG